MVMGEFEFDNLYNSAHGSEVNQVFSMILLIGLMIIGPVIMLNLIVAFIITDVSLLLKFARDQMIINQVSKFIPTKGSL